MPPADLRVDEIFDALARGASAQLGPAVAVSQLDHALQTAAWLAHRHPGDTELAVAGLVHDIGHLLPGGSDETHAEDAARAVGRALGPRVAGIVALHVDAKRYLVATEPDYDGILAADSVASLLGQRGAMTEDEAARFLSRPWAEDAVALRRADDGAKVDGLEVGDLTRWVSPARGLPGGTGA